MWSIMYEYAIVSGPGVLREHGIADGEQIELCALSLWPGEYLMVTEAEGGTEEERFH